jgi:multiple sugar transport system substrate-binding protein
MSKRVPLTCLFLVSLWLMLTGCTTKTPSGPGDAASTTPLTTERSATATRPAFIPNITLTPKKQPTYLGISPEELDGTTLSFWHPWTGEEAATLEALVDDFNRSNGYDLSVSVSAYGDNLYDTVLEALNTGIPPDLTVGYNHQILAWNSYGEAVIDLNLYLYETDWGLNDKERSDFYSELLTMNEVQGKQLGLPVYASVVALFYNNAWGEELGFDAPPTTTREFKEQACASAASNNDSSGGWIATTDPSAIMGWIFAFGGSITSPDGEGYQPDNPEVESAFAYLKGLFNSGCAWQSESAYPMETFADRQGLFYAGSIAGLSAQREAFTQAGNRDEWTVIPFPGFEGQPVSVIYGPAYAILRSSPEKQLAAWLLIKWLTQPENQASWIKASQYLPTRDSARQLLDEGLSITPQREAAQALIPLGRGEPSYVSWSVARWALSDATTTLLSTDFSSEEIPELLEDLEMVLEEIHIQRR